MFEAAVGLENTTAVFAEIDKIIDSKEVKEFKEYAEFVVLLHALPYILWISMFIFVCFWMADTPACCCFSQDKGAGFAYSCHLFFWIFFFIVIAVLTLVGYGIEEGAKTQKLEQFKGSPTIKVFIDHLKLEFPKAYEIVLQDLLTAMISFRQSCTSLSIIVLLILGYGCGICLTCGGPYGVSKD